MKDLFAAGKVLLGDLASTLFFLAVYLLTHDIVLAVVLGIGLGVGQIGWRLARRQPVEAMEWLSLVIVVGAGGATLVTRDPRFVMLKPSLIYLVVGAVMLRRGWMNRYLPARAIVMLPDVGVAFGFVWAGLMFASAALNLVLALNLDVLTWSAVMSAYGLASKLVLVLIQYAIMRAIGGRRWRAMAPADQDRVRQRLAAATTPSGRESG